MSATRRFEEASTGSNGEACTGHESRMNCQSSKSSGSRRKSPARRDRMPSGLILVCLIALPVGACGGGNVGDIASGEPPAPGANREPAVASPDVPRLDLSPSPPIAGFAAYEGSCTEFPLHVQHPSEWEISTTGNAFGNVRIDDDDDSFSVRISEDVGSIVVAEQLAMARQLGATTVGEVTIAGQTVEVLGGGTGGYLLFVPHSWGGDLVGYYSIEVYSSLGDAETLRILDSLVPVGGCVDGG